MVNADRTILVRTRLIAQIEKVPPGDSFKASKKSKSSPRQCPVHFCECHSLPVSFCFTACQMIHPGMVTILGPTAANAANHLQCLANQMHIPLLETRWDYTSERKQDYAFNIHPHPSILGKVSCHILITLINYPLIIVCRRMLTW